MTAPSKTQLASLRAGQEALGRCAWKEARECFEKAVRAGKPDPEALDGLGMAAWWVEDYTTAIEVREEAYRLYRGQGNRRAAARMAFYLAMDYADARSELAVAAGWMARGKRELEGLPPTSELAMVLLLEGHQALMGENDTVRARRLASEAIELARSVGPPDLEVLALAMEGLAQVSEGNVASGMRLLDEATTAALAGDLTDWNLIGTACCYLIHACERVRDLERAAQWCERVQAFCRKRNFASMFTVCRTHYASVLILSGAWDQAEAELMAATDELRSTRPAAISSGIIRLAELRRRQGRAEEASQLFEQAPHHRMALIGGAELALAGGRPERARDLVAQYLRRFPKQTRTERVVGLELAVRVESALGHVDAAGEALGELKEIAETLGTDPLRATHLYAQGVLAAAAEKAEESRVFLEDASDLFDRGDMPYEGACARLALARTALLLGRREEALEQAKRVRSAAEKLGAAGLERDSADLIKTIMERASVNASDSESGQVAPRVEERDEGRDERHVEERVEERVERPAAAAAVPLTAREVEVLRLIARGLSDRQIAEALFLSQHTVHRHVSNMLTKLDLSSRAAAVAYASRHGAI